jgi:hypothetical protein
MHRQIGGIYNTVGVASKISETLFFKSHSFQYREMWQQWMGPPRLRESSNENFFASFEKYQLNRMAKRLNPLKNSHKIRKKHTLPDINAERDIPNLAPLLMTQLDKGRQKSRRQIIDAEIPDIFEALESMRLP